MENQNLLGALKHLCQSGDYAPRWHDDDEVSNSNVTAEAESLAEEIKTDATRFNHLLKKVVKLSPKKTAGTCTKCGKLMQTWVEAGMCFIECPTCGVFVGKTRNDALMEMRYKENPEMRLVNQMSGRRKK